MARGNGANDNLAVRLGDVTAAVGKGLAAGFAGTAAMTLSSSVEAKLRHRPPSSNPARAASVALGVAPVDERGERPALPLLEAHVLGRARSRVRSHRHAARR